MVAPKSKQHRQIPTRQTKPLRRIHGSKVTSDSESPPDHTPYYDEEEEDSRQSGNSNGYPVSENDSTSDTHRRRNEYYSSEAAIESIPETTPELALMNSVQSSSKYMNIAPLPVFRGTPEECPISHLSRFTKVCRANNVNSTEMMMRIFPVTLENEAALWYDLEIEPYPSLTWEEIKSSFLNVYRTTEFIDKYRSELMVIKQGENESVHSFFLRIQWILRRWPDHGIPEEVLKGIFMDGLRKDFQDWIDPQNPETLHDALRLALSWEQAKGIRAARNKKSVTGRLVKCGFCDGPHEEAVCEIRAKMRELWFRIKEKRMRMGAVQGATAGSDGECGGMGYGKTVSVASSSNVGQGDGEGKGGGGEGCGKNSQCHFWKHHFWKKKLE